MKKVIIALGGNALGNTPEEQKKAVQLTASMIIPIIKKGYRVVITHGNGPQVGSINLAFEEATTINKKIPNMPFPECGSMSQGYIGYHLQNALRNELIRNGISYDVVTIVTEVLVDINDPAFKNPTKPIGSFYSYEESLSKPFVMKEDAGRGYRRVIASPKPIDILQKSTISNIIESGSIVICVGGGGIPVIHNETGYHGIDAVIDKDYASSKLGDLIDADILLILTAVPNVCISFGTTDVKSLNKLTLSEAIKYNEQGEFKEGSMKPKVEACLSFIHSPKERLAIITSIENACLALDGKAGTIITK